MNHGVVAPISFFLNSPNHVNTLERYKALIQLLTIPLNRPIITHSKEDTMDSTTTTDFSKFGYREREEAEQLLKASREQGFPDDFDDNETTIMFNMQSGNVFFTNADF